MEDNRHRVSRICGRNYDQSQLGKEAFILQEVQMYQLLKYNLVEVPVIQQYISSSC